MRATYVAVRRESRHFHINIERHVSRQLSYQSETSRILSAYYRWYSYLLNCTAYYN